METPHPDERPLKKRRFFTEDSSPAQVEPVRPASPQSPIPRATSAHEDAGKAEEDFGAFDVGMLQAIVGELPLSTLQTLNVVSGGDVQRGEYNLWHALLPLIACSHQPLS